MRTVRICSSSASGVTRSSATCRAMHSREEILSALPSCLDLTPRRVGKTFEQAVRGIIRRDGAVEVDQDMAVWSSFTVRTLTEHRSTKPVPAWVGRLSSGYARQERAEWLSVETLTSDEGKNTKRTGYRTMRLSADVSWRWWNLPKPPCDTRTVKTASDSARMTLSAASMTYRTRPFHSQRPK